MKITKFRIMQMMEAASADCHTVEDYAMSHFGTTELPEHVKVEIVGVTEEEPKDEQINETKADDGQAAESTAQA